MMPGANSSAASSCELLAITAIGSLEEEEGEDAIAKQPSKAND